MFTQVGFGGHARHVGEVKSRNDLHSICFRANPLFHQAAQLLSAVVAHVGPAFSCKSAVTCSSIVRFTSRGTWFTDPHPSCRSGLNHTCDRPVTTRAKRSKIARGRARVLVACVRLAQRTAHGDICAPAAAAFAGSSSANRSSATWPLESPQS